MGPRDDDLTQRLRELERLIDAGDLTMEQAAGQLAQELGSEAVPQALANLARLAGRGGQG